MGGDKDLPAQAVKHYLAARDLFNQYMDAEAIAELERALRYDPGSYECHLLLGRAALRSGNLGLARSHLRQAAKLYPNDIHCQCLLGLVALKDNDFDEALKRFRLGLICPNADPGSALTVSTHLGLGNVLLKKGYLSAAIKQAQADGATAEQLAPILDLQRRAAWRLDFISSENSSGFHASQEAARILAESIDFSRQAQVMAVRQKAQRSGVAEPTDK